MRPQPIYNPDELELDFRQTAARHQRNRKINPQRHEMEQLTGVTPSTGKTTG